MAAFVKQERQESAALKMLPQKVKQSNTEQEKAVVIVRLKNGRVQQNTGVFFQ